MLIVLATLLASPTSTCEINRLPQQRPRVLLLGLNTTAWVLVPRGQRSRVSNIDPIGPDWSHCELVLVAKRKTQTCYNFFTITLVASFRVTGVACIPRIEDVLGWGVEMHFWRPPLLLLIFILPLLFTSHIIIVFL